MAAFRGRGLLASLLSSLFLELLLTDGPASIIASDTVNNPNGRTLLLTYMPECVNSGATERALRRTLSRAAARKRSEDSDIVQLESIDAAYERNPVKSHVVNEYDAYRTKLISLESVKHSEQAGEGGTFEPMDCSISEESLKRVGVDVIELRNCVLVDGEDIKEALEFDPCVASVEFDQEFSIDALHPPAHADASVEGSQHEEDDSEVESDAPVSGLFSRRRTPPSSLSAGKPARTEPPFSFSGGASDDVEVNYWRNKSGLNDALYDLADCDPQRVVAVIDTGVSYTHPALAKNMWVNINEIPGNGIDDDRNGFIDDVYGFNFRDNKGDPMDDHGHGTHVAGIIGAMKAPNPRVQGVCGRTSIAGLKFMGSNGNGSTSDAIKALNYAVQMRIPLSCNSWGGPTWSEALIAALEAAESVGHLFIAAAGNQGRNTDEIPHYPASYRLPNVISVAATNSEDQLAPFSNRGESTVDVAAPGVKILSTFPPDQFRELSGTSMATPVVAGVAAMLMSLPFTDPKQIKEAIVSGVDKMPAAKGLVKSGGRVNASKSVSWLAKELGLETEIKNRQKKNDEEPLEDEGDDESEVDQIQGFPSITP
ncbi:subtilisin SUB7 [Besnoitia besnoiti]|uniref:subtilisin n=1 Tax=Besnoitia besnoiti TaxID=94643 RepID=A0A2A9MLJ0_BESBE|nr:subtilisin SUB7 [Besnoitia besnoiti]PFH38134.1 subtilisin SUB7 [Besnoitia besnoiti]